MPAVTASTRARPWEWIQAALLAANLAWTTLCLGGRLFAPLVVTSALTCALLTVHLIARAVDGRAAPRSHPAGWLLLPFLVYATINVAWITPVQWLGWQDWFGWAQMIATFWVVVNGVHSRGPRRLLLGTLAALGLVAVLLACYQRFVRPDWLMLGRVQAAQFIGRSAGPFGNPNNLAGLLLLVLPPCIGLALHRAASATQRVLFGWLTAALALGLVLTISRGGWIAFALAMVLWPLLSPRWTWRRRITIAGGVLVVMLIASAGVYGFSPKVRDRVQMMVRQSGELSRPVMWRAAWKIFCTHPAFGSGAGSYNLFYEPFRPELDQSEPKWAHNDYLNTLSDYGAVGGVLVFGAAGVIAWRASRRPRASEEKNRHHAGSDIDEAGIRRAFAMGLLAFALHLLVDFHLKIPALALSFVTIAGLLVGRTWPMSEDHERVTTSRVPRFAAAAATALVVFVGAKWIVPRVRAEGIREEARSRLNALVRHPLPPAEKRTVVEQSRTAFSRAVALDPTNAQAWADHAYALAILAHEDPAQEKELGREAEADARRALAQTPLVPEFWLRLGVALDMQRRWVEAGEALNEALNLAPKDAAAWFCLGYHLALNPVTLPLARSAVATCLRLDPSYSQAETLHRYLAAGR